MNPLDDGSNGSLLVAFIAAALIGGITLTLHTLWQLRRLDLSGTDDDSTDVTIVLLNPWTGDRPGTSWQAS